jgi:hypothetical protein
MKVHQAACRNMKAERDVIEAATIDLLETAERAFFWIGNTGANADMNHTFRPVWEALRSAIAKARVLDKEPADAKG